MAPVTGTVILTVAGQVAIASVLGFDQNGNPMPADFVMPPATFIIDDEKVASLVEDPDGETATITALADGIANVEVSLKTAEGKELSDTEEVEVNITNPPPPPPPAPVLTSIKIAFDVQPAPGETVKATDSATTEEPAAADPEGQATTSAPAAAPLSPNQAIAGAASTGTGPVVTEIDPNLEPAK
ncbi:MAG TPA: hypothetical protein VL498_06970 [Terracidiphilus sp.]|nr:hypothetical protein [Terracidiphilus sp.]